jgi:SSS family solute:Na+ symporter/sodium/pantothenate symporter
MGFPSLVYSHGWVVAVWISSYMVVPLVSFGVFGKRLAQMTRHTGAITVPDLFRARYGSPAVGLTASLFILVFMSAMMVAQFKAGALIMKLSWPGSGDLALVEDAGDLDQKYYVGLAIFTLTVVGYTLIGGFLAAVWTDLFQSVMMLIGVAVLTVLVVPAAGGLEAATRQAVAHTGDGFAFGPGYAADGRQFLPVGLAASFFCVWMLTNLGNPAGLIRVMACKNTQTLRRSIYLLSVYNMFIYLPLIAICVAGRALLPNLKVTDEIIPRLSLMTTQHLPLGSFIAGLILAAPFGAVMATVSGYLVLIASGLVRDIYQRFIDPHADERRIKWLARAVMVVVGAGAVAANLRPVNYLQAIVVFSGTGAAATFLVPAFMALYWRRATAAGTLAAMLAGAGTLLGLFVAGWLGPDPMIGPATSFRPYYLLGLDPVVWGVSASLVAGVGGSLLTRPPEQELVARLFDPPAAEAKGSADGGGPLDGTDAQPGRGA